MIAEILSVGTELLMGQIANTDAQYISRRLSELGVTIYRHVTVGDNPARVKEAIGEALTRADIVITTGGLGPTEDDLTKEMVGEYFGLDMELHQPSLDAIESYMNRIGRTMTENNKKQAYFPAGAIIMPNLCGTAPGCIVEQNEKAVAVLPGPPRELKDMFDRQLAPYLARRSGMHIESKFLRTFGIGESSLETMLIDLFHSANPTLALYCGPGEVQARISARAETVEEAQALIQPLEDEILRRVGTAFYGYGVDYTMAHAVFDLLRARGETVTFTESCTGGMVAASLIECPGASDVLTESSPTPTPPKPASSASPPTPSPPTPPCPPSAPPKWPKARAAPPAPPGASPPPATPAPTAVPPNTPSAPSSSASPAPIPPPPTNSTSEATATGCAPSPPPTPSTP